MATVRTTTTFSIETQRRRCHADVAVLVEVIGTAPSSAPPFTVLFCRSDDSCEAIARNCPRLLRLGLPYNEGITSRGIRYLADGLQDMLELDIFWTVSDTRRENGGDSDGRFRCDRDSTRALPI